MNGGDAVAFPTLTEAGIRALSALGVERDVTPGQILFSEGDRDFCFFVMLDATVEIVEHSSGTEKVVTVHQQGGFTGDVDMLSGRAALVTARVKTPGRVLAISTEGLRRAINGMPDLSEILLKAFLARRAMLLEGGYEGIKIIGSRFSSDTHRLRDFANRNAIPFTFLDVEEDKSAEAILCNFKVPVACTPVVLSRDGTLLRNPSVSELGHLLGLDVRIGADELYDLVVVGAGPAGLAASVYAASEGLRVLTLDAVAAGGQAGTSTAIENYLGFPTGISGAELTANALLQAQKFGASISVPVTVVGLRIDNGVRVIVLEDGSEVHAKCVLVASGVEYRRLAVPGLREHEGLGVYYAATDMEARLCRDDEVVVVGGGNSAGQAVVYLSRYASKIHVVIRSNDLGRSMSRYLVDRVESIETVQIHYASEVTGISGNGRIEQVTLRCDDGTERVIGTTALFMFIGATAHTDWLQGCVELDGKGFVLTGEDVVTRMRTQNAANPAARAPYFLETSMPGVFAAGDARSGSVKRVASAVGEGAMAVSFVHAHLSASAPAAR